MAHTVKNPLAIQETRIQSLSWEAPQEKGMATHSSILAWRIPCTEKPGGLQSMGSQSQTRLGDWHFRNKNTQFLETVTVKVFLESLMPCSLGLFTSLFRLVFVSTILIEVYPQRSFHLKGPSLVFFWLVKTLLCSLLLWILWGQNDCCVKSYCIQIYLSWTVLRETEGALVQVIEVTRAAFLPSSNVPSLNTGGYRWLQYMVLIHAFYSDVSFLQITL